MNSCKQVTFKYGAEKVSVSIPNKNLIWEADIGLVDKPVTDGEIRKAIRKAVSSTSMAQKVLNSEGKICILVDDGTRITPQRRLLSILIEELLSFGAKEESIFLLIALGSHRPMSTEECIERYGEDIVKKYKVINHDYNDPKQLVELGATASGIPIRVNKHYYESSLSIALGTIVPHLYAGWSGGCKMVQPGVCGADTTAQTHLMAAKNCHEILGNVSNPVRMEIEEVGIKSGLDLIINAIIDAENKVAGIVAGDPIKAHREGVKICEKLSVCNIPEQADIVIASAYPAERDFWQANKALNAIPLGIKRGGTLVFLAPCWEGVAPDHPLFADLATTSIERVEQGLLNKEYKDLIAVATYIAMSKAREHMDTIVISHGMSEKECKHMGLNWAPNVQQGLLMALAKHGNDAKIGVANHAADIILRA